jgi:glucose/arabinose dehydrogenase
VFSPDGKKMYVSIGSRSNVSDNAAEENRARIFEFNPDGSGQKFTPGEFATPSASRFGQAQTSFG